ncbi:MAG: hypothetical protein R2849_20430 [Thermomicrobiales bacterium]
MEITDRGLLYPVLGIAVATIFTALYQIITGDFPGLISIANLSLLGLGIGLVVARFGKLGPFEGVLGSPWTENRILETLNRETARSLRYGRDLTILAFRAADKQKLDASRAVRATDQLIVCRNGWNLLVLPETDHTGAQLLLRHICVDRPVLAAVVSPDPDRPRQRMESELLELVRSASKPGVIEIHESQARALPLAG